MSIVSDEKREAKKASIIEALECGATLEEAAVMVGVSSRQIRRWRTDDRELDEAVLDAMSSVDDRVEAITYRNCLDPDPAHNTLRMFWLKCRRPDVFRDKQEITGANGGPLKVIVEYADADPQVDAPPPPRGPEGDPEDS